MKIIKLHSDKEVYTNPQQLTPNQKKWLSRYVELSGDEWDAVVEPPAEYHEVYEWENGWIDYTIENGIFWVWTLYSHNDGNRDGLSEGKSGDAIEIGINLAKKLGCRYIEFDTHRDPKEWELCTKKYGKIKIVSRQIRLDLNS